MINGMSGQSDRLRMLDEVHRTMEYGGCAEDSIQTLLNTYMDVSVLQ